MRITMIKKQLSTGQPCNKCAQAEALLRERGFWPRIDEVVWAVEDDPRSAGMRLAETHGVSLAPFFIVQEDDGSQRVYTSALKLLKDQLGHVPKNQRARSSESDSRTAQNPDQTLQQELQQLAEALVQAEPEAIVRAAFERYGADCAIAFSGAEDVALIDMASKTGLPFSVFCLDTGRLHPETYEFLERVRKRYRIEIRMMLPDTNALEVFVRKKGLFSFYEDGHQECCSIRKVEPLKRALRDCSAWMTGQRQDQSPTRSDLSALEIDANHQGATPLLAKFNPLAHQSSSQVWQYIRDNQVPYNRLHDSGYISIGCAPCTRPARPGEHERAARWWWEEATQRECGLHVAPKPR